MRGQDRRDAGAREQLADAFGRPTAVGEPRHRLGRRSFGRRIDVRLLAADAPDHLTFLREIDELEIQAERVGERLSRIDIERVQLRRERPSGGGIAALPERDRLDAAAFDQLEQLHAALLGDDLAEQRAEQLHFERERVQARARTHRSRLGKDRGVGLSTHEGEDTAGRRTGPRSVAPQVPIDRLDAPAEQTNLPYPLAGTDHRFGRARIGPFGGSPRSVQPVLKRPGPIRWLG